MAVFILSVCFLLKTTRFFTMSCLLTVHLRNLVNSDKTGFGIRRYKLLFCFASALFILLAFYFSILLILLSCEKEINDNKVSVKKKRRRNRRIEPAFSALR